MVQISSKSNEFKVSEKEQQILRILYENREGLRAKTLEKLTELETRNLYKKLNNLLEEDLVENVFPIWRLTNKALKIIQGRSEIWSKLLRGDKIIELHDLSFVIRLVNKPEWWSKRENYLQRLKEWNFKNVVWGNNPYQQILNENFVVQTYQDSIIVMNRKRYHSDDAYKCFLEGLDDFMMILGYLEERFRFKFFPNETPNVTVRTSHFLRINDVLSKKCMQENKKFLVEVNPRQKLWVDLSKPFGTEANTPETMEKYEELIQDRLTKPSLLPSELTRISEENQQSIRELTENLKNIKDISNSQIMLSQILEQMNNNMIKMTKEIAELKNKR